MAPAFTQPVLVYSRIAQNRRRTWLLLAVAVLSLIPFVAAASYGASQIVLSQFSRRPPVSVGQYEQVRRALETHSSQYRSEMAAAFERRMQTESRARANAEKENYSLRLEIMAVVSAG